MGPTIPDSGPGICRILVSEYWRQPARRHAMLPTPTTRRVLSRELLDVLIRAGLVAVLAIFCVRIFLPFLNLMVWALILAITLYPLQVRLRRSLGGKDGLIATVIILCAFV